MTFGQFHPQAITPIILILVDITARLHGLEQRMQRAFVQSGPGADVSYLELPVLIVEQVENLQCSVYRLDGRHAYPRG